MAEDDSNVVFNFAGTQEGVINVAGRDMHVGNQTHVALDLEAFRRELASLRSGLSSAGLPPQARQAAETELQRAEDELRKEEPDGNALAEGVGQFAEIVKSVGGLAGAGAFLVDPLTRLAKYLGPLGGIVQRVLA
jgi:hypothetical protein